MPDARTAAAGLSPSERIARRRSPYTHVLWSLLAIFVTLVFFFPLFWAISTSLRNPVDTFTVTGIGFPWLDFQPTLDNFKTELSTPEGWKAIQTSLIVSVSAVLLALVLGVPAAYALARFRFLRWTNSNITVWFLSQRVLPPVATLLPFYIIFRSFGMLDTPLALILINATFILPFVVVILRQTFLDLPVELEEAALVDGCSRYRIFWSIILPLSKPGLVATFILVLIMSWNEYLFALFLSSANAQTLPLTVAAQNATRGPQWWYMSVLIIIMIIPVCALAILLARFITRGLLIGAVKG